MKFKFKNCDGEVLTSEQSKHVYHYKENVLIFREDNEELKMDGILYHHDFFHQHRWLEFIFTNHERGFEWRTDSNAKWFFVREDEGHFFLIAMDQDFNYLFAFFEAPLTLEQLTTTDQGVVKIEELLQGEKGLEVIDNNYSSVSCILESMRYIFDQQGNMMSVIFYTCTDLENHTGQYEYTAIPTLEHDVDIDLSILVP